MDDVKKIDRPAIDAAVEAVMELVCANCYSDRETPTGCKSPDCENCPIEGKVREVASLVEHEVAVAFAHAMAAPLKAHFAGGAPS